MGRLIRLILATGLFILLLIITITVTKGLLNRGINRLNKNPKARSDIQGFTNKGASAFELGDKYNEAWLNDFIKAWKKLNDSEKSNKMNLKVTRAKAYDYYKWLKYNNYISSERYIALERYFDGDIPSSLTTYYPTYLKWRVKAEIYFDFYRYLFMSKQISSNERIRLKNDLLKSKNIENYNVPYEYSKRFLDYKRNASDGRNNTKKISDNTMFNTDGEFIGNKPVYIICVTATKSKIDAQGKAKELQTKGYEAGYLWIPNYRSLSGAEYYEVFIGPYLTQLDCEIATEEYRKTNPSAYGLLVSQENKRIEIRGIGNVKITY